MWYHPAVGTQHVFLILHMQELQREHYVLKIHVPNVGIGGTKHVAYGGLTDPRTHQGIGFYTVPRQSQGHLCLGKLGQNLDVL